MIVSMDGSPAPLFVGRKKERTQLVELMSRGRRVLVCGAAGIGKSALVHAVLAELETRARYECRSGDTLDELVGGLMHALGSRLPSDPVQSDLVPAHVLECAEKACCTVVVDDLHHLSEPDSESWVELVSAASTSTWVFTSRSRIESPGLLVLELGPLDDAGARELAQRHGLRDASPGVPLWIEQLAAAQDVGDSAEASAFLDGLSPERLRQLAMLSLTRGRLPQAARHEVSAANQLDALRAALESRDIAQVAAVLGEHQEWIHAGLGAQLWELLAGEHDSALAVAKMRIAVAIGSGPSLDWLADQPAPAHDDARLDWAEGLLRSGRTRRALAVLRESDSSARAKLLLGEALFEAGEAAESVRVLRAVEPSDDEQALRRDSKLARALFHADEGDEAKRLLQSLERRAVSLGSETLKAELNAERSALRLLLGLTDDRKVEATPSLGSLGRVFQGIRLAALGRYRHSSEIITALRSLDVPASTSVLAGVVQGILRVTRGRYKGLSETAREMVREAERLGNAPLYHWSFMLERAANLGNAAAHPELEWASNIPKPTGIPQRYIHALRITHRARLGEPIDMDQLPKAAPGDGPLVMCICDLTEATAQLLGGDPDRAQLLAAAVTQQTVRLGYFFFEGEALLIQCYAQLKLGRWDGLSHAVDSLEKLARSLRSKRYGAIARLLRLSLSDRPKLSALLSLSQDSDVSPTAARVARTLLGGEVSGDALDALLVDGLRVRWTQDIETMKGCFGVAAGWGIDAEAKMLALPGREVPISPLALRLLNCLFDEPREGASLSRIGKVVWGIEDYHQLRDSKRVHVAVRRLRTLLEEAPSTPTRLLTVDEGYALSTLDAPARLVPPFHREKRASLA